MSYTAYIARVANVRPHPNADKLKLATIMGYTVIIGLDTHEGELGLLIPEDGQICKEFCLQQGLFRKHPDTGEKLSGYLDHHGHVRTLKLRGAVSEALWLPLQALREFNPAKADKVDGLVEGQEITEWQGDVLFQKYISVSTAKASGLANLVSPKSKKRPDPEMVALDRHYDTAQLRHVMASLPVGDWYVTLKMHGTSGRTGHVQLEYRAKLPWYSRLWNRFCPASWEIDGPMEWRVISGTRNCIVKAGVSGEKGKDFRQQAHEQLAGVIPQGTTVYYELIGYESVDGKPIMARHSVGDVGDKTFEKELIKLYGKAPFDYHYGHDVHLDPANPWSIRVYRIVENGRELTYDEITSWCFDRGLLAVPLVALLDEDSVQAMVEEGTIMEFISSLVDKPDPVGKTHPTEGVCIRVEKDGEVLSRACKHKSLHFRALEGLALTDDNYVDTEAAS
jgi:hypothetical protein